MINAEVEKKELFLQRDEKVDRIGFLIRLHRLLRHIARIWIKEREKEKQVQRCRGTMDMNRLPGTGTVVVKLKPLPWS